MTEGIRWHLELGGEVIAHVADAHDYDFPWTYGTLVESTEFERFRPYFTDPDEGSDDDPTIEAICSEVRSRGGFVLRDFQTGQIHPGFHLNQRDETVWFRIG